MMYEIIQTRVAGVTTHAHVLTLHARQHLSSQQLIVTKCLLPIERPFQRQQTTTHPVEVDAPLRSE